MISFFLKTQNNPIISRCYPTAFSEVFHFFKNAGEGGCKTHHLKTKKALRQQNSPHRNLNSVTQIHFVEPVYTHTHRTHTLSYIIQTQPLSTLLQAAFNLKFVTRVL